MPYTSKLTEAQLGNFLRILRDPDAPSDVQTSCLGHIKLYIKQHHIPDDNIPVMFDIINAALPSRSSSLMAAALSALAHLMKRLTLQGIVSRPALRLLTGPALVQNLLYVLSTKPTDLENKTLKLLFNIWHDHPRQVEDTIREDVLFMEPAKIRLEAIEWVLKVCSFGSLG